MIAGYTLTTTQTEDQAAFDAVKAQIRAFNRRLKPEFYFNEQGEPVTYEPLYLILTDDTGDMVAGLSAGSLWGCMHVHDLWVAEQVRGQGIGSTLLQTAEHHARERECRFIWLTTYSWQARPFYEKHGYRVVGELADYPPGHALYTMRKDLGS